MCRELLLGVPPIISLLLLLIFEPIFRNTVRYLLCEGDVSFSLFSVKQELLDVIYKILLLFGVPPKLFLTPSVPRAQKG